MVAQLETQDFETDALIKAMSAGGQTPIDEDKLKLKVESLDFSMKILTSTSKCLSFWKLLGYYDCKIRIPRKKKKQLNNFDRIIYKEKYRIKIMSKYDMFKIETYREHLENFSRDKEKGMRLIVLKCLYPNTK